MKRRLTLDYALPTGRLTPYFEALSEGRARTLCCTNCGQVAFPPSLTCAGCGEPEGDWMTLSGIADVLQRTDTPDASFALVRFEGALAATMVQLRNPELKTKRGRLVPPETDAGLWLELEEPEDES